MNFTFVGAYQTHPILHRFAEGLRRTLEAHGHQYAEDRGRDLRLVFNFIDPERPRPYRRRAKATFVVSVALGTPGVEDVLRAAYPLLVRSLANLVIYLVPEGEGWRTYFVTLEQGRYEVGGEGEAYFERVYERLYPLATSQLVIDNEFHPDLPEELWEGDALTQKLSEAGRRLDALQLLPSPFPIEELLSPRDLRHVQRLYGIGGLSYGNLSVRKDATRFWMSASGVNKANLRVIGRDILLVKGYDPVRNRILLSVPPHIQPRRVSVDAIEHWMIYTEHPSVGAIIHVHAWMRGIPSTEINYPCGTLQLAKAVADLVRQAPDPTRAVVGLKNHGITVTGPDLEDILERLERDIIRQVPMT
ncbi:MAG: class II aldolase/adducin family protein [Armatimonadetes bacterium]|nr:class II aldolase/adducin family protein [Armatimonadota bacterium]MDW8153800.1 class II aldolase/adducin family protein [Armatimonadota bacterium]